MTDVDGRSAPQGYVERPVSRPLRWILSVLAAMGRWASEELTRRRRRQRARRVQRLRPDGKVVLRGSVFPSDEKSYVILPFEVAPGISRLDLEYDWTVLPPHIPENPITQTVLDLGLWDEHGYRSADGFRGWSGSRHKEIFIEAGAAERGYRPGPINPGTWYVELGLAAVGPTGADWKVTIRGKVGGSRPDGAPPLDPVDGTHVARADPGWYHGDFHMHSWHSNPHAPTPDEFVKFARQAHLDFLPVTEYVVGHHWNEYGRVQRDNDDLVIWPGREIITYFGHMQSLGETPGFIEYRHGFEDVRIGEIQRAVRDGGALFQVNHPTTGTGPLLKRFCRGCAFELVDEIDWHAVDTMEVLTGSVMVKPTDFVNLPDFGIEIANPYVRPAIELWEQHLNLGHRITAVCGSDDKLGPHLGICATAVYAGELSRPAIADAIKAGRAYVRCRGVTDSPTLEMEAAGPGGQTGTFGSTVELDQEASAVITVTVGSGRGQSLRVIRNGDVIETVPVTDDPFVHRFAARRVSDEGPLGTWYRVETFDVRSLTTIGNPVFVAGPDPTSASE